MFWSLVVTSQEILHQPIQPVLTNSSMPSDGIEKKSDSSDVVVSGLKLLLQSLATSSKTTAAEMELTGSEEVECLPVCCMM